MCRNDSASFVVNRQSHDRATAVNDVGKWLVDMDIAPSPLQLRFGRLRGWPQVLHAVLGRTPRPPIGWMKLDRWRENSFDNRLPINRDRSIVASIIRDWFRIAVSHAVRGVYGRTQIEVGFQPLSPVAS